jgi:copper(I)-binding protein
MKFEGIKHLLTRFRRGSEPLAGSVGAIEIRQAWARSTSTSAVTAGGFFTVVNKGATADRLVSVSSPVVQRIEIHAIKVVGPDIAMCPLENGLAIPADSSVTLRPRGYHLMMIGLKAPLAVGATVPVTLAFERAGSVDIELTVEAPGIVGEKVLHEERELR